MREIKFRGLMTNGNWIYGLPSLDLPHSTAYYNECSYRICWHPEDGGQANAPIKNGTLSQFTGIFDKNDKEIYEGDIVRCFLNEEVIGEIDLVEFKFGCFWLRKRYLSIHEFENMDLETDGSLEIEIIGNIHENLELIKQLNKEK